MSTDPRALIVEVCHLLAARNFTSATGGNVSVRLPDGSCWVTPSQLHKARVQVADLVRVAADGRQLDGTRSATSETYMHLSVYRRIPTAGAVLHAHPPVSTGFALAGKPMDNTSSSEAVAILGRCVPLLPYLPPSSASLAALVEQSVTPSVPAYLLAHHGVLTWGPDLWQAYDILDTLELFAQSLVAATQLGAPVPLPEEELRWLDHKNAEISIQTGRCAPEV